MDPAFLLASYGSNDGRGPCVIAPFAIHLRFDSVRSVFPANFDHPDREVLDVWLDGKTLQPILESEAIAGPGPDPCGPFTDGQWLKESPWRLSVRHVVLDGHSAPRGLEVRMGYALSAGILSMDFSAFMYRATPIQVVSNTSPFNASFIEPDPSVRMVTAGTGNYFGPLELAVVFRWKGDWE